MQIKSKTTVILINRFHLILSQFYIIIPKIKNNRKPPKNADVCQTVSFSSCASINNSSVTKNNKADKPNDSTTSIALSDSLCNKVAPKTALAKKITEREIINIIDFCLLTLFCPNSVAVAMPNESTSTDKAIANSMPSAAPG